jgi:Putative peptidoglycan binding domain
MSKESSNLKEVKSEPGLTTEEKTWLKKLGAIVGNSAGEAEDKDDAAAPVGAKQGAGQSLEKKSLAGDKSDLVGLPGLGDIPGIIKTLTGPITCTCTIDNNTDQTLILDKESTKEIEHGDLTKPPPNRIKPQQRGVEFIAVNRKFLGQSLTGAEGFIRYFVDDQKTVWRIHFNNPRISDPFKGGHNNADANLSGPNQAAVDKFETSQPSATDGDDAHFAFALDLAGGPPPNPQPNPQPGPVTDVKSSCLITVNNNTKLVLALADQGHDRGDFMTFPPQSIQPGGSAQFVSVETPHSKEQGCKGFVSWEVGSPAAAVWRVEWDNPEEAKNTAKATADPQSAGFRSTAQIGQDDENVPVVFTISGGGQSPTPPVPVPPVPVPPVPVPPVPPPEIEPEFNPPVAARQPTLRKGDKSEDGWVEYLQLLLNIKGAKLDADGNFGSGTEKAVRKFQADNGIQVDGVAGNQTWAALREGAPEKPSSDGRQPHTFVEHGAEARWEAEKEDAFYDSAADELSIFICSVGDARIDDGTATVRVTPPNTKPSVRKITIGPPINERPSGAGHVHAVKLANFKKTFPALDANGNVDPKAKVEDYKLEGFLEAELGGDSFKSKKIISDTV